MSKIKFCILFIISNLEEKKQKIGIFSKAFELEEGTNKSEIARFGYFYYIC